MTASHLAHLGEPAPTDLGVRLRNESWSAVVEIARAGINSPMTSSAGRLFDAVAALLDVRDRINYEGQAAIELERLADPGERGAYRASVSSGDGTHVAAGSDLVAAALADLRHGLARPAIAMRFHRGVASAVAEVCRRIRSDSGIGTVALSGGVFLNRVLLIESIRRLEADGFSVLRHRRVPCNDGGISFGQAVVAAALDRRGLIGS
jgi:hydrogenase maturation protein HypF